MWLSRVLDEVGDRVLRVKGLIEVPGTQGPLVVNAVQRRLYPLAKLPAWPSDARGSRLVFVVEGDLQGRVLDLLAELEGGAATGRSPECAA